MRAYFERLERVRYAPPRPENPERHGYDGWLPMEMVKTSGNLFKDRWLTNYVVSRVRGEENGELLDRACETGGDFELDPNDWSLVCRRGTGLVNPPRSAENGARRGTRELLLDAAARYPDKLTIRTDCLVTRLLFDDQDRQRVIGVEYLEGPH